MELVCFLDVIDVAVEIDVVAEIDAAVLTIHFYFGHGFSFN